MREKGKENGREWLCMSKGGFIRMAAVWMDERAGEKMRGR